MTDPQTNDVEVPEDVLEDDSTAVIYELSIQLQNGRMTAQQKAALYRQMVKFARQARISLMFALPDKTMSKVTLNRTSSGTGRHKVEYFQEE